MQVKHRAAVIKLAPSPPCGKTRRQMISAPEWQTAPGGCFPKLSVNKQLGKICTSSSLLPVKAFYPSKAALPSSSPGDISERCLPQPVAPPQRYVCLLPCIMAKTSPGSLSYNTEHGRAFFMVMYRREKKTSVPCSSPNRMSACL